MKTVLMVVATCVMATVMSDLTLTGTNSKDRLPFPIQKPGGSESNIGRPRIPALSLFTAFVDTDMNAVLVSSNYYVDDVFAIIENVDTGEIFEYTFRSGQAAFLPISSSLGLWRITLILNDDSEYTGEFEL